MTEELHERPGCFARLMGMFGLSQTKQTRSQTKTENTLVEDAGDLQGSYDYKLRTDYLSPAEVSFYHVMREVTPSGTVIMAKVRLGDLFIVPNTSASAQSQRNRINLKHVDFVLCDAQTMRPLAGIELDDSSHQRPDRVERDVLVENVFRSAGLPLIRFPARRGYIPREIGQELERVVGHSSRIVASPPPTTKSPTDTPPDCPKCGSKMVIRTVKNGSNAGRQFYGCTNYPNCRGMLALPS